MTAEIINFRKAQKAKARADKEKRAEANRAKFGRTKNEKTRRAREEALADRRLEGHARDKSGEPEPER